MSGTGRRSSQSFVGDRHFVITPSDSVNFLEAGTNKPIDAAVVALTAGTVVVVDTAGVAVSWVISAVPFAIPVRARRVNATGTTGGMTLMGVY